MKILGGESSTRWLQGQEGVRVGGHKGRRVQGEKGHGGQVGARAGGCNGRRVGDTRVKGHKGLSILMHVIPDDTYIHRMANSICRSPPCTGPQAPPLRLLQRATIEVTI